jgi:hypothetical protein
MNIAPVDPHCPAVKQFIEVLPLLDPTIREEIRSGEISAVSAEILNAFKVKHRQECPRCLKYGENPRP